MNARPMALAFYLRHILTILGAIAIIAIARLYYVKEEQNSSFNAQRFHIAIFEPAIHSAMDEISQGFIDTMNKNSRLKYTYKRYNAQGNKTLMRSLADEIIQKDYDLVMSIGSDPTRILHELTSKKKRDTPIIFNAVSDPVGLGIIASTQASGNNLTGIEETPDYEDQLTTLIALKPNTHNILLVFDPSIKAGIHEVWAQEIKNIAASKGITVQYAKVFHTTEIQSKVQPLLHTTDVVLILTDHTTVSGIDSLITLCNRYHVTLYASDLNSGDKGAALSYGVLQYDLGVDAGNIGLEILEHGKTPAEIPTISPSVKRIKINTATMHAQGLIISEAQQESLKQSGVIFI